MDILKFIGLVDMDLIFVGINLDIVERVLEVLNLYFLIKCFYFMDFDIWKYEENWNLYLGDIIEFMIRFFKNYDYL